jgi:hypothetical protein
LSASVKPTIGRDALLGENIEFHGGKSERIEVLSMIAYVSSNTNGPARLLAYARTPAAIRLAGGIQFGGAGDAGTIPRGLFCFLAIARV